jgi:hypothetical protein
MGTLTLTTPHHGVVWLEDAEMLVPSSPLSSLSPSAHSVKIEKTILPKFYVYLYFIYYYLFIYLFYVNFPFDTGGSLNMFRGISQQQPAVQVQQQYY